MNKGYTKIPNELLDTCELSLQARYLLCVLIRHNAGTGKCFPTQATLGKEIGRSAKQVRVILTELVKAKAITKKQRGFNRSNDYFISKKYIVKNLPTTKDKNYGDQTKTYTQKRYKSSTHKNPDDLHNSNQEIVKDNIYIEKEKEFSDKMRGFFSDIKLSNKKTKFDSFSNKKDSYEVYNKKTGNIESVREILESKQLCASRDSDLVTGHMNDLSDHKVSSDTNSTLTKSLTTKTVDNDSTNVDSRQKGEETC